MKFALITDQHFGVRDSSQFFIDNYKNFYLNTFFPTLLKEGVKLIICLGDTWEDRRKLNINALTSAQEMYFDQAEQHGIKIISILGNHDVFYRNTNQIHGMKIIDDAYDNMDLIYENRILDLDGFKLGLMSWVNKENYNAQMEFIENCDVDYLAGHFEINGFEMTKGSYCEGGFKQELFKRFDEVWSGHFHIRSYQGNIRYLGNPSQTNKGDIGMIRGFHIFNTKGRDLQFYPNPYNVYESIRYNDDIDISAFDYDFYTNKMVCVYVKSLVDCNQKKLNIFIDKLSKYSYKYEVEEYDSGVDLESGELLDIEYKNNIDIINDYVSSTTECDVKQQLLKSKLNDLYSRALTVSEDE